MLKYEKGVAINLTLNHLRDSFQFCSKERVKNCCKYLAHFKIVLFQSVVLQEETKKKHCFCFKFSKLSYLVIKKMSR